ncbi:malate synthase A [Aeribacillus sp. FSL K6-2848]|uniref:Malate synthase n=1 Tax=Aeribacillus pallidus TaxID=33936 RepID=A0A165Z2H5_9BACI|nr:MULTISPECIES: malate synthase A [Aeribacillus]ASS90466.1 malate synthase A [Aeribacillus pallidus]KZN97750.1 malate synthase A [Aeribacillus pallidus]MDR9792565.1 malate synthase A [Aeribacillus pallidus]MED0702550.1 malate synthase A [Aeribacillus composti]MED0716475.1 malate synthase A [Aeribacillus composti]
MKASAASRLEVKGTLLPSYREILTNEALQFVEKLEQTFGSRRIELLELRKERERRINEGEKPSFLKETEHIRKGDWTIPPVPKDLQDRRVEITGPVDRKMIINALNSGAKVFMADFEDATSPTWENIVEGQIHLRDAVNKTIEYVNENGKVYKLNEETATLIVRPRGLHLEEKHVLLDGKRISGSLFDFGLYFFHNAKELIKRGSGPYFYLPKLESHLEARWWNDVFCFAQDELGVKRGTIKATVLIETILAAFEMDEILYELKEHSAGLNCGRWDYIFSYLKKFRNDQNVILPDRAQVTMTVPFMRAYSLLAIKTCHRRNVHAIGGMAAQIPVKDDPVKNEEAFQKVRADKEREAKDGHDGTWVAHPALVPVAKEIFDQYMKQPNQIDKQLDVEISAEQLLEVPEGTITEQGLRTNIDVGIRYLASWLSGRGAAPIHNLMEDAATAEISRAQVWQWIRHPKGVLEDGRKVTIELYEKIKQEELEKIKQEFGEEAYQKGRFDEAAKLFDELVRNDEFVDFLTLPGYERLN